MHLAGAFIHSALNISTCDNIRASFPYNSLGLSALLKPTTVTADLNPPFQATSMLARFLNHCLQFSHFSPWLNQNWNNIQKTFVLFLKTAQLNMYTLTTAIFLSNHWSCVHSVLQRYYDRVTCRGSSAAKNTFFIYAHTLYIVTKQTISVPVFTCKTN